MKMRLVVFFLLMAMSVFHSSIDEAYAAPDSTANTGNISRLSPPQGRLPIEPNGFLGAWLIGIRGGFSDPFDDKSFVSTTHPGDIYADLGPYVGASALYGFARYFMAGVDVDYYSLPLSQYPGGFGIGSSQTVSIIPVLELRSDKLGGVVSIYGLLGAGVTLNSFSNSSALNEVCAANNLGCMTSVDPESLGIRMALGVDFFVTDTIAFNTEVGAAFNLANAKLALNQNPTVPLYGHSTNLSTVFFLFGIDYLIPR